MNRTDIEYLDFSWSPIAMRCTPTSQGCTHCWHLRMANRLAGNSVFPDDVRAAYAGDGPPVLIQKRLEEPLHRKKPAVIGTQWMGDLFHEDISFMLMVNVLSIIARTLQHTYLFLTKRPGRMKAFVEATEDYQSDRFDSLFPNVWLGVTVENSDNLWRIDELLKCRAAVSFVSFEPLLGPIKLRPEWIELELQAFGANGIKCFPRINWAIVGGESGPGARPTNPDWARSLRNQCQAANTPYFFKQWGAWLSVEQNGCWSAENDIPGRVNRWVAPDGSFCNDFGPLGMIRMARVGKKAAGRLLDGQTWDEFPTGIE